MHHNTTWKKGFLSLGAALVITSVPVLQPAVAKPWNVIERANRSSQRNPDAFGYMNAIMKYDYEAGQLYQVYCAPLRITDIQLEPGEALTSEPVGGDVVRWILARTKSKLDGLDQEHIYVKPTRPGLKTTLSINTNVRTYHIELTSYEKTYMPAVSWNYEQYNMKQLRLESAASIEPKVNISSLNFRYNIDVKKGRRPAWLPLKVFDDGRKTFIRLVGGAVLSSLLSVGATVSQGSYTDEASMSMQQRMAASVGQNIATTGSQITRKNLDIQPTLIIQAGKAVNILVNKDMIISPYNSKG